jgi:hypothetical protein
LLVEADGGGIPGTLFASVGVGGGGHKGSYTMTYSDTARLYVAQAVGFSPNTSVSGSLALTTTLGLESGTLEFTRAYVEANAAQTVRAPDGNVELELVSADTLPSDTYIAVAPSFAPPGALPAGHRLVGSVYSLRAAGALVTSDKPMLVRMRYADATLAGADPHTLGIFAWDAFSREWQPLGGRLALAERAVSVAASRFTTYALMAGPAWNDDFADQSGLTQLDNTRVVAGRLALASVPGSGSAVSTPIGGPPIASWGTLTFSASANGVVVDVLDANGAALLTDVTSGASLSTIDAGRHPLIRLRVRLVANTSEQPPTLDSWRVTWSTDDRRAFFPSVWR